MIFDMQLLAEEDVLNTCLNHLKTKFTLKNDQLTLLSGEQLKQSAQSDIYQQALHDSLKTIAKDYHQPLPLKRYQNLNPATFYIMIYRHHQIRLIFPYGANLATILAGALIQNRKNPRINVGQELNHLVNKTIDDLVLHEIYKYYQPAKGSNTMISPKYTRSIRYQGLKSDSFNLMIKFVLPLNMIYQPLQTAIQKDSQQHHQSPKTNYNQLALSNLISLAYDRKQDQVTFVTTLYS